MPTPDSWPESNRRLRISGFSLGHGSDREGMTGVTVILCPEGATGAAEVRGSATGTRQFDSLTQMHHIATRCHGVVLSGGSGFGLAAADPVVEHLRAAGYGFDSGAGLVPLVPTAILFDLGLAGAARRAHAELAVEALAAVDGEVACGSVGAGTGATVGKALSIERAMKGGFGFAAATLPSGLEVAAAVAVNAFGDVRDPQTGRIVAGCRTTPDGPEFASADRVLVSRPPDERPVWESNTTLAVVMTNAALSRVALRKVCEMAFGGLYRALLPALTLYDGDLVMALARGEHPAHLHQVGVLAEHLVAEAIVTAAREADGFGRLPAVRDLSAA